MTDEELIGLFGAADEGGSDAAWAAFLDAFEGRIRYTCRYWMNRYGRPDEAEDRFQDVVVLLCKDNFRAIREFVPGRAKMSTWVSAIATNTCRGWFRSRDRTVFAPTTRGGEGEVRPEPADPEATDPLGAITDDLAGQRMVRALAECSVHLDDKRKMLFVARLLLQLAHDRKVTMSEVGRIFDHSPQRTKYQLDTTLEQLRDCVRKKTEEPS